MCVCLKMDSLKILKERNKYTYTKPIVMHKRIIKVECGKRRMQFVCKSHTCTMQEKNGEVKRKNKKQKKTGDKKATHEK